MTADTNFYNISKKKYMSITELLLLAIALAMDAFAASICIGISIKKQLFTAMLVAGLYFGFFQGIMPVIGYYAGIFFARYITEIDHWVAFIILVFIGGKLIYESIKHRNSECREINMKTKIMLCLAIATSIDALAVGISFAFLHVNLIISAIIIGVTTFAISAVGVKIGNVFGCRYKLIAERVGGVILILVGVKILLEHLIV